MARAEDEEVAALVLAAAIPLERMIVQFASHQLLVEACLLSELLECFDLVQESLLQGRLLLV